MTVRADSPHRATHGGREYFFCGARCKRKFEAESERYLRVSGRAPDQLRWEIGPAGRGFVAVSRRAA